MDSPLLSLDISDLMATQSGEMVKPVTPEGLLEDGLAPGELMDVQVCVCVYIYILCVGGCVCVGRGCGCVETVCAGVRVGILPCVQHVKLFS